MFGSAQVSVDVRLQIGYDIQGDHESSAFYSGQVRPHPHQKVAMFDINDVWHLNKRTVWSGWSACNMLQCWQCYISSTSACDPVILITDAASDSARKAPRNDPESPLLRWYWLSKWGGSRFGNFPVSTDRFVVIFFDGSRGNGGLIFDWSMFAGNDALVQLRQLGLVTFYNVFVRRCVCVPSE